MIVKDWRQVLKRAWSVRLMLIAGLLSGLEAALPMLGGLFDVPSGALAGLSCFTVAGAFFARLFAQKGFRDES